MKNVTFVQYAGDYKDAFEHLSCGGEEIYQSQRYSVNKIGELARLCSNVSFIVGITKEIYDVHLPNDVRAIGMGFDNEFDNTKLIDKIINTKPTHIVLTTPNGAVLDWARKKNIPVLCVFADSFASRGLKNRIKTLLFSKKLASKNIEWIANHGLNSSISLKNIGIDPKKIIPWDWPSQYTPHNVSPKVRLSKSLNLAYVGSVSIAKGVGDIIHAVKILRHRGLELKITICGEDKNKLIHNMVSSFGLDNIVEFKGIVSNKTAFNIMHSADMVIIPSHHEYPEGLPLTIYEALSARTPIIASDHPMFRGNLIDGYSSVIFKAADPLSLADAIDRLNKDHKLYANLSSNSLTAWNNIQIPVKFGDLIQNWVLGNVEWLSFHSINSNLYKNRIDNHTFKL